MRLILLCALAICVSVSGVLAADLHRDSNVILKEYDAIKTPTFDAAKQTDAAYVRKYAQEKSAAVEKQNALAEELYKSNPKHPRAVPLMATRLTSTLNG